MNTSQGMTLQESLQQRSPLEPPLVAKLGLHIAQQVAATGETRIVHPGRIHLLPDGSARLLPTPAEDLALPAVVEYPAYASPEEIQGRKPDLRSALYSLGCTLHEALTGQPPFSGTDPRRVLHSHLQSPPPDIHQTVPAVPLSLSETVRELLEKDPELRIQSAEELIRRLKQYLLGAGVSLPRTAAAAPQSPPAAPSRRPAPAPTARPAPSQPSIDDELGLESQPAPLPPQRATAPRRPAPLVPAPRQPAAGSARPVSTPGRARPALASQQPATSRAAARGAAPPGRRAQPAAGRAAPSRLRGPAGGREANLDLDEEGEEQAAWAPRERRTFAIAIAGAIIGVLIGGFVYYKKSEESAARLREHRQTALEALVKEEHKKRKDNFSSQVASERTEVTNALTRGKARPAAERQDALLNSMKVLAAHSTAPTIASDVAKNWTPPEPKLTEELQEEDKAYAARKAEAESLFGEGKYGDAVVKLLEDSNLVEKRHGKEIAELQKKYEQALTTRWREDEIKYQRLASAGDADRAIEVLRGAMAYADAQLRKDIDVAIDSIQKQVAIQVGSGKSGEEEVDSGAGGEGDGDAEGTDKPAEKPAEPDPDEFADPAESGGKDKPAGKDSGGDEEEE